MIAIVPAAAESIFHIGSMPITNSMINAWIAVVFFVIFGLVMRKRAEMLPKKLQNAVELILETMINEMDKVTGSRVNTKRFLPIVGSIFFFVLFSNWIGLIPGTGSIGIYEMVHGEVELVPLFRPATSDLNMTLAMSVISLVLWHAFGLVSLGFVSHFSKFFNFRGIVHSIKKGPMQILTSIVEFFVGLLEVISEVAKALSLSLRLFGNIFAGEVLLTVMLGIFSYVLPVPFMFLELLVGLIQATIFAMLVLAFMTVSTQEHEHSE
ncbi:MAG: hypothetical protein ACD_76C00108G0001 [uncultured bacterium]|nr:MAG: hypothetical protein ACD_76C00108G0001 [uncultured bacterium]HBD05553.1 ATP synthase F0 subunit A [Candidatus Uhrbacteria bacterium]